MSMYTYLFKQNCGLSFSFDFIYVYKDFQILSFSFFKLVFTAFPYFFKHNCR